MDYVGLLFLNMVLALMVAWFSRPSPVRVLVPMRIKRIGKRVSRRR